MEGLMINSVDLLEDYGYDIETIIIRTAPTPKTKYMDITGMDGSLDYTEQDGIIRYKSGTMQVKLSKQADMPEHYQKTMCIKQLCHGKKCQIVFPYDLDFYLSGRISVKESCDGYWSSVELTITYDPYRYKRELTYREITVSGKTGLLCYNLQRNVIPDIQCSAAMTVTFSGKTYNLASGENSISEIIFTAGENLLEFIGTGTVAVSYQEASL